MPNAIVKLNVGGQQFVTTRTTLCAVEGSMLASMFCKDSQFAPPLEMDGAIFLDRDPTAFPYLLNYLRDSCRLVGELPKDILARLRADADCFGLVDLVQRCNERLSKPQSEPAKKRPSYSYKVMGSNDRLPREGDWKLTHVIPGLVADDRIKQPPQ